MKKRLRQWAAALCALALGVSLAACSSVEEEAGADGVFDYGGRVTLRILSGSENRELEPILDAFAKEHRINIAMEYQGSLDIMRALQSGAQFAGFLPDSLFGERAGRKGRQTARAAPPDNVDGAELPGEYAGSPLQRRFAVGSRIVRAEINQKKGAENTCPVFSGP